MTFPRGWIRAGDGSERRGIPWPAMSQGTCIVSSYIDTSLVAMKSPWQAGGGFPDDEMEQIITGTYLVRALKKGRTDVQAGRYRIVE